ncbi:hypothetical protein MPER_07689, partial [Moniliophthora perniciosa FA553]
MRPTLMRRTGKITYIRFLDDPQINYIFTFLSQRTLDLVTKLLSYYCCKPQDATRMLLNAVIVVEDRMIFVVGLFNQAAGCR